MLWIKRNLVLVISGAIALVLLVVGGLYFSSALADNKRLEEELNGTKEELAKMYRAPVFPNADNVAKADAETRRALDAVAATKKHFVPVPYTPVPDKEFKTLLDNTIFELTRKAEQAGVRLPETNYAFTFRAQKSLMKYSKESVPFLPEMLADVKALCGILFDAKCNLRNLRRERLSVDDPAGTPDYIELKREVDPTTQNVLVPFEITVSCFTRQLSTLLDGLARSPHGFITQVLLVEPESGQSPEVRREPKPGTPASGAAPAPAPRRGGPPGLAPVVAEASDNQVVLIEQALRVQLLVKVVRPPEPAGGRTAK